MKAWFCLGIAALFTITSVGRADHHGGGFTSIFDGKSLKGWDGDTNFWSVRDGALTGQTTPDNPTERNTFIIWRGGTLENFELRLKVRIVGGNSGIQYRSQDRGDWVVAGYQADLEAGDRYSGILYDEKGRAVLAERGELNRIVASGGGHQVKKVARLGDSAEINSVIKKEDWNDYRILAEGNRLTHIINGRVTCQVIDEDRANFDASGILAFQLHTGPPMTIQFKDIQLKKLH